MLSATGTDQAIEPPQPPGEARGEKSERRVLRAVKTRGVFSGVSLLRAGLGVWWVVGAAGVVVVDSTPLHTPDIYPRHVSRC